MIFAKQQTANGAELVMVLEQQDYDLIARRRILGAWEPVIGEAVQEPMVQMQAYSYKIVMACALFGIEMLDGGSGVLVDVGQPKRMLSAWNFRK